MRRFCSSDNSSVIPGNVLSFTSLLRCAKRAVYGLADKPLRAVEVVFAHGMTMAAAEHDAVGLRGVAMNADDGGLGHGRFGRAFFLGAAVSGCSPNPFRRRSQSSARAW